MPNLTGKNQTQFGFKSVEIEAGHCQIFNIGIRKHLSSEVFLKYFKSCFPFITFWVCFVIFLYNMG